MAMSKESPQQDDIGAPVDPMRIVLALGRRRWGVAGAAIFGAIIGAGLSKTLVPPVFEARSVLECDRCTANDFGDRELATLQESVKLPNHIEKAREKLGIDASIERIGRDIDVNASIESRLIQVTARGKTGDLAANLANVIVDAFMETRLQVEKAKLADRLHTVKIDADKARKAVVEAREQYDKFRSEHNIADLPAEREAAIQEAARLRSESAIARGEQQAEEARVRALLRESSKEPLTAIVQQREDLPDAKRLSVAKEEMATARARFTADHPRVLALASEVEALERKVAASNEAVTTGRTVAPNPQRESAKLGILQGIAGHEAASTRGSAYEKLAQTAAQAAARLSSIEGRASELLSNLQTAERHSATMELDKKDAEVAARSPSTGLRILAIARTPPTPIKSSRKIAVLLGPIFGCILAALAVALHELRGLRIRTANELAFWGQGPVLGSSQWPTSEAAFGDLVSDIVGAVRGAKGKTMLVGASTAELAHLKPLVHAIQKEMSRERERQELPESSMDALLQLDTAGSLRRATRDVDRIVVIVEAGLHSAWALRSFVRKIARPQQVAFVLINAPADHDSLPDVVGDVAAFRNASL
jgi:uncharacterized protein involved in exopolysaccharide biosynthesis